MEIELIDVQPQKSGRADLSMLGKLHDTAARFSSHVASSFLYREVHGIAVELIFKALPEVLPGLAKQQADHMTLLPFRSI